MRVGRALEVRARLLLCELGLDLLELLRRSHVRRVQPVAQHAHAEEEEERGSGVLRVLA